MQLWKVDGSVEEYPEKLQELGDLQAHLSVPFAVLCAAHVTGLGICSILGNRQSTQPLNQKATLLVGRQVFGNILVLKKGTEIK